MRKTRLISSLLTASLMLGATTVFAGGPPAGAHKMPTPKADIYIVPNQR